MRELPEPATEEIDLASVMHALADPSRLRSVAALSETDGVTTCTDLADLAGAEGLAKSTWSHHLRVLREAGVIRTRHDGTRKLVSSGAMTSTVASRAFWTPSSRGRGRRWPGTKCRSAEALLQCAVRRPPGGPSCVPVLCGASLLHFSWP